MLGTPLKVLFFLNVTYMLHFAFSLNLVVELAIAEMVVSHPSSRVRAHSPAKLHTVKFCFPEYPHDCNQSFALFVSSDSFLNAFSHILCSGARHRRNGVRFLKRPHDSFRVPYGVPVQRSISERDVSHPSCLI